MGGNQRQPSSRLGGLKSAAAENGGEIVEVHGGHIVRSTGRKDRHSKVCTAKGPRDRRVRLSANTAIQFYDVQDRLGYDRPSKAVDWLIKKAKTAIDELAELPAWNPLAPVSTNPESNRETHGVAQVGGTGSSSRGTMAAASEEEDGGGDGGFGSMENAHNDDGSGFLPPSLDSDAIADTIKSFFPVGGSANASSSSPMAAVQFQSYQPPQDLLSRTTSTQSQDLKLSLQFLADPILLHQRAHQNQQILFSGSTAASMGFDNLATAVPGWPENPASEMNRFQRMLGWNWNNGGTESAIATGAASSGGSGGGGFVFASPPPPLQVLQPLFGQNGQLSSQRGPLQSSNTPSIRAWLEPDMVEHQYHHQMPPAMISNHPSLISGIGFASGFQIPARIRGMEDRNDGAFDKPSSASSDSRH